MSLPTVHTLLQCKDVARLPQDLCLVQAIAPDCSALPCLLRLMNLSHSLGLSSEATASLKPFTTLRQSGSHHSCHVTYDTVL